MGTSRRAGFLDQAIGYVSAQLAKEPDSLVVILGPTCSGKTALALELAKEFSGEIVSADSRLVYRDMDIGTAKPSTQELLAVKHHLVDIFSPDEVCTVADFQRLAFASIEHIFAQKKTPFVVGGTMLYIDSVVYNYSLSQVARETVQNVRDWSLEELQQKLLELNPEAVNFIDWKNPVRLMRVLEYFYQTGDWLWERQQKNPPRHPYIILGLQVEKNILRKRIEDRVRKQLENGLVEEVKNIMQKYPHSTTAMTGIGYRQVAAFLRGECSFEEMQNQIIKDTVAYAKRQMTWWKRNPEINWLPIVD